MTFPSFYDPANAARWDYDPPVARIFEEASRLNLPAAADDAHKVALVIVDGQKDFCLPQGSLYVGGRSGLGAVDDSRRIAEFIYRNVGVLSTVAVTIDSHLPWQIFFPSFWQDEAGAPVPAYATIEADEADRFRFTFDGQTYTPCRPNPAAAQFTGGDGAALVRQCGHYCRELQRTEHYRLIIWPYHCLIGSEGWTLVGVLQEARLFHSFARRAHSPAEIKGTHPLSENYSVFGPEVLSRYDGSPMLERNEHFLELVLSHDRVVVVGQAASHCVKATLDDLLAEIHDRDPGLAHKVAVGIDMTSAVAVPDGHGGFLADFTPQAEAAFARYAAAGMRLIRSTDDLRAALEI